MVGEGVADVLQGDTAYNAWNMLSRVQGHVQYKTPETIVGQSCVRVHAVHGVHVQGTRIA